MKRAFLISVLASFTTIVSAQKIELGLNGGAAFVKGNPINYYSSLRGQVNVSGWQVGMAGDWMQERSVKVYSMGITGAQSIERKTINTSVNPNVFVNKLIQNKTGYFYAGVNLGWNIVRHQTKDDNTEISSWKRNAFLGGAQAGYTLFLTKHLGINAEAGARWMDWRRSYFIFPVSAGIRYHF